MAAQPRRIAVTLAFALAAASCSSAGAEIAVPAPPTTAAVEVLGTSTVPTTAALPTTTSTAPEERCLASLDEGIVEAPPSVVEALDVATMHPGFEGLDVSISVWIDGWGEVAALNPEMQLAPASNQKLLVAYAANTSIDPAHRFRTSIEHVGNDLVLRSGGDPTLTSAHVAALAEEVVAAGIVEADRLIVDVSAYPQPPRAAGWLDWQIPTYVGPLSGLMIDDNRWVETPEFVDDPALTNGDRVVEILNASGVAVGHAQVGSAQPGAVVAEHSSAPVGELIPQDAALERQPTRRPSRDGARASGLPVEERSPTVLLPSMRSSRDCVFHSTERVMTALVSVARISDQHANFRQLLRAMRGSAAGELLSTQLPVGGVSGTLQSRFGSADAGRVSAKTGTIIGGRSLSGYATTDSGRDAVFSIIVNGDADQASASRTAIDAFVTAILRS